MDDWDGKWWADSLEREDRDKYCALVDRLKICAPDQIEGIAKEIFQAGHECGYDLARDLSYED